MTRPARCWVRKPVPQATSRTEAWKAPRQQARNRPIPRASRADPRRKQAGTQIPVVVFRRAPVVVDPLRLPHISIHFRNPWYPARRYHQAWSSYKEIFMSDSSHDFDFIVIGSGFGGSVTAHRLTEKGYRVAVMEMGRRWTPENLP